MPFNNPDAFDENCHRKLKAKGKQTLGRCPSCKLGSMGYTCRFYNADGSWKIISPYD